VPDFGERGRESMKNKIKYTDEPMGELKVVKDFLPPPDQLVLKEDRVKVTISLSKGSVEFFKKEAKKRRTSYQKMIRRIIDVYTSQYQKNA
jgi:predicted DNA binding CopG/RHH family protein